MSKVFFDIGISLDGFISGQNRGPDNPLGDGGLGIHEWMFRQKAFGETHGLEGGELDDQDGTLIREVFARTGAYIMGKRMFEEGEFAWPEDLFKAPVYVLTHEKRDPWVQQGCTSFYFVNQGPEYALEMAKETCKGKDIRIQGGAETIRQYLDTGKIDEFTIHIAPLLLGSGLRLLDGSPADSPNLAIQKTVVSDVATHVFYKVLR